MTTYKDAGVDIDAANTGLKKVKKHAKTTFNKYTSLSKSFLIRYKSFSNVLNL